MAQPVKTLDDIARLDCSYLVPAQVAPVLGCSQYAINCAARSEESRKRLGFPTMMIGNRCKIPRIPFLAFMGYQHDVDIMVPMLVGCQQEDNNHDDD